jgi:hypothetical protein
MIMVEMFSGERLFAGLEAHQIMFQGARAPAPRPPCARRCPHAAGARSAHAEAGAAPAARSGSPALPARPGACARARLPD